MFFYVVCTCPFSSLPLYTLPKPPSPRRQSERKFFVAVASSRNVNAFAVLETEQLPLGGSVLVGVSDDGLCFEVTGDGLTDPAKWQEHLVILTRFPGRRFILAWGLLHNRDLPGFQPPGRHLLLRLETPKAAHHLPTNAQTNLQTSLCGQWEHGWVSICRIIIILLPPCAKDLAYRQSIGCWCFVRGKCDLCGEMWSDGMSICFMPLRGGGFAEPRIGSWGS